MKIINILLWAAAAITFGCMEFVSTDSLFLGFSIIMAAQYLDWKI